MAVVDDDFDAVGRIILGPTYAKVPHRIKCGIMAFARLKVVKAVGEDLAIHTCAQDVIDEMKETVEFFRRTKELGIREGWPTPGVPDKKDHH
jgi:hypothetical protein